MSAEARSLKILKIQIENGYINLDGPECSLDKKIIKIALREYAEKRRIKGVFDNDEK